MAGKYQPLTDFLQAQPGEVVTLTFEHLEQVLGESLPASARQHAAWWANEIGDTRHVQARAWLAAGWRVEAVAPGAATFRRSYPTTEA